MDYQLFTACFYKFRLYYYINHYPKEKCDVNGGKDVNNTKHN